MLHLGEVRDEAADVGLGVLWNVSDRWAVGPVVSVGGGPVGVTGVQLRTRRWLDDRWSVEAESGALRSDTGVFSPGVAQWGITAGLRLNWANHLSSFVRYETAPLEDDDGRSRWRGQWSLGMGVGPTETAIGLVVGLAAAILFGDPT
jgi:hypothetical protein